MNVAFSFGMFELKVIFLPIRLTFIHLITYMLALPKVTTFNNSLLFAFSFLFNSPKYTVSRYLRDARNENSLVIYHQNVRKQILPRTSSKKLVDYLFKM